MKIISLSYSEAGYACSIGTSIKIKYKLTTNFFDYLVVDMSTINEILNLSNLELLLSNYEINKIKNYEYNSVTNKNFKKFISYHDLKNNYNEKDIQIFKNKYLRRYYRLMNDIYNEKIIYFIRYGKTSYEEIINLYNNILKKNEKLIIYFINVDYDNNNNENIIYDDLPRYIYINFKNINKNIIEKEDIYFKILEYNWDFVFNLIEKNYKLYMSNN